MVGNVASGAADSGDPVKVGTIHHTSLPSFTDGERADLQSDSFGQLIVAPSLGPGSTVGWKAISLNADAQSVPGSTIIPLVGAYGVVYNGSTWDRERTPIVFKDVSVAVTAGTPQTVWTPTSGKKFRLMGWELALSVAGAVIFHDGNPGTALWRTGALAAGVAVAAPNIGNGYLSTAANNVLSVDTSASGTVTGFVFGTEE